MHEFWFVHPWWGKLMFCCCKTSSAKFSPSRWLFRHFEEYQFHEPLDVGQLIWCKVWNPNNWQEILTTNFLFHSKYVDFYLSFTLQSSLLWLGSHLSHAVTLDSIRPLFLQHLPAEKHHHGISLGGDEAQEEDVATAAVVTLQHRLAERPIFMQRHLFAFGSYQVIHNVTESRRTGEKK